MSWLSFLLLLLLVRVNAASQHGEVHTPAKESDLLATASTPTVAPVSSASVISVLASGNSTAKLARARKIVEDALEKFAVSNKARLENVRRNNYKLKPGSLKLRRDGVPSLVITDEMAEAAALLTELEASEEQANGTLHRDYSSPDRVKRTALPVLQQRGDGYWMAGLDNLGTQPFGGNASYRVFRNVKDYGAKGDGLTDDTKAINLAISDGDRCGAHCFGSSVKSAVVYFPPGTYLVSRSIVSYFHTQLIGDPTNRPVIKASKFFLGLGVISTDVYYPEGGTGPDGNSAEWYINTANFYRQIRNFVIDISETRKNSGTAGLHYQVAQATSLTNLDFHASTADDTTQQAIFAENGSGGFMSDLTFTGGAYGIFGGSQQFTASRMKFSQCKTAIRLIWDWGWIWREMTFENNHVGISLVSEDGVHHTGSLLVQDSTFTGVDTAVLSFPPTAEPKKGTTGITFDNVRFKSVKAAIADSAGKTWLDGSVGNVDTFTLGPAFFDGTTTGNYTLGQMSKTPRIAELTRTGGASDPKAEFFSRPKPDYVGAKIVQMKHFAKGDGVTDDTAAFQDAIKKYANTGTVIFIDAGSYILTDTINVPSGAKIVGQSWSQLVAAGPKFSDASKPHVLFRVGAEGGETGNVEIQDLLFTSKGATAGFVAVEWNLAADAQGSAAMWDCHVRIGGAKGTDLSVADCPAVKSGTNAKCSAGALMFHMTKTASAYIENMWLWVADHDLDDADMTQVSVYVARGMLIESTKPVWLYGTASEHATFYQYGFYKAKNVLAAMIQTESAYYQPNPPPPAPFADAVGVYPGDPDYSACHRDAAADGCDESWAVRFVKSSDITIAGAGLYSWFKTYSQACVDTQDCQRALVEMADSRAGIRIWNIITIGAKRIIVWAGSKASNAISAGDYTSVDYHPFWSQVSLFHSAGGGDDGDGEGGDVIYVAPTIWGPGGQPTASCIPPCTLVLPPSQLGFATTISWPPLTTSLVQSEAGGSVSTFLTTISIPAVTTTEIEWWPITVHSGDATQATFTVVQSVMPPPVVVTLPGSVATVGPTKIPVYSGGRPASSSSQTTSTSTIVPVFFPGPHTVDVQPQPTVSVNLDPTPDPTSTTTTPIVVTYTSQAPKSTCEPGSKGCGKIGCENFGCGGGCGLFACNNGCSILGCGGGCGLTGCGRLCPPFLPCSGVQCPLDKCGGAGCASGGCGTQQEGDCTPEEVNDCTYIVSSTLTKEPGQYTTTTKTHCTKFQGCDGHDKSTTRTQTGPDEKYPTVTPSQAMYAMAPVPDATWASIASEFLMDEARWDASRYSSASKPLPTLWTHCADDLKYHRKIPESSFKKALARICDGRTIHHSDCTETAPDPSSPACSIWYKQDLPGVRIEYWLAFSYSNMDKLGQWHDCTGLTGSYTLGDICTSAFDKLSTCKSGGDLYGGEALLDRCVSLEVGAYDSDTSNGAHFIDIPA